MRTIAIEGENAEELREQLRKVRDEILQREEFKNATDAQRAKVVAEFERQETRMLREGPAKTSLRSLIDGLKDVLRDSESYPKAVMALATLATEKHQCFILGGIAGDIVTAQQSLAAARKRLSDYLDALDDEGVQ